MSTVFAPVMPAGARLSYKQRITLFKISASGREFASTWFCSIGHSRISLSAREVKSSGSSAFGFWLFSVFLGCRFLRLRFSRILFFGCRAADWTKRPILTKPPVFPNRVIVVNFHTIPAASCFITFTDNFDDRSYFKFAVKLKIASNALANFVFPVHVCPYFRSCRY